MFRKWLISLYLIVTVSLAASAQLKNTPAVSEKSLLFILIVFGFIDLQAQRKKIKYLSGIEFSKLIKEQ
ncbi:MAG: hypothetical protein ABI863_09095 [Ginsengibacter sp.]